MLGAATCAAGVIPLGLLFIAAGVFAIVRMGRDEFPGVIQHAASGQLLVAFASGGVEWVPAHAARTY